MLSPPPVVVVLSAAAAKTLLARGMDTLCALSLAAAAVSLSTSLSLLLLLLLVVLMLPLLLLVLLLLLVSWKGGKNIQPVWRQLAPFTLRQSGRVLICRTAASLGNNGGGSGSRS